MDKMFDSSFRYGVSSFPHTDTSSRVVVSLVRNLVPNPIPRVFRLPAPPSVGGKMRYPGNEVVRLAVLRSRLIDSSAAFHYAKDSGNFGRNSNGKVRFGFFRLEYWRFLPTGIFGLTSGGGPLISFGIFRPKFAVPFLQTGSLP